MLGISSYRAARVSVGERLTPCRGDSPTTANCHGGAAETTTNIPATHTEQLYSD